MKLSFNFTNFFASIALVVVGMMIENYRVWNPGKLTGWSFAGFAILFVLAILFGVFIILAYRARNNPNGHRLVYVAAAIAFIEGALGMFLFMQFDISWSTIWRGMVFGLILGGLIALISFTFWIHPKRVSGIGVTVARKPRVGFLP